MQILEVAIILHMEKQKFKFINDKYRKNRGGTSKFLNIYCEHCGSFLLLYQKDGPGPLKRIYLDRIMAPKKLFDLQNQQEISNLICQNCKRIIAIPSVYKEERRKVYLLLAYTIIKKTGKGVYPPQVVKLERV